MPPVPGAVGPELRYDFPDHADWPLAKRYRGQAQTLFLLDYHGPADGLAPKAVERPEFRRVRWVTPACALELIAPPKRDGLWRTLFAWLAELPVSA